MGKAGKLAIIFWAQISCEKNIWPSKLKGALPVKPRFQPFLGKKTEDHAKPNKDEESGLYDVPRFWKNDAVELVELIQCRNFMMTEVPVNLRNIRTWRGF